MGAPSVRKARSALHAAVTCPPAAEPALAFAWELGELDADCLTVPVPVEGDPAAQLRALAAARPLCGGHPLLVAIVLTEIGRRADMAVGLVAGVRGHFVAHQRLCRQLVLDPARGELVDAGSLGVL